MSKSSRIQLPATMSLHRKVHALSAQAQDAEPVEPPAPHVVSVRELKGLGGRYDEAVASGQYKPTFFTRVAVNVARGMFVESEPTKIVTYSDGTIYIQLGGGPSAGAMAGQASAIGGVVTAAKAGKIFQESMDEILDALFEEMTGSPVGPSGIKPRKTSPGAPRIYWTKTKNFENYKVYQRDDLIDPKRVDTEGRTNLDRMRMGSSPIGPDGKRLVLHHINQANEGPLAEMTETFHTKYGKVIHIDRRAASQIDRRRFDNKRERYWTQRAKDFEENHESH